MELVSQLQDSSRRRKRKRISKHPFNVDDKIEVRSEEEGLLGSWHAATVIYRVKRGCHYEYRFKYDNMLTDDGSEYLVDEVCVSHVGDETDEHNYHGQIRPYPPLVELRKWGLSYGFCVDAHYLDAWWEGVVFDHEDGSDKRMIFFPDQGDAMLIKVDELRVTQVWNEVTAIWQPRGTWLFLELFEDIDPEWCLPTITRLIWYDVQEIEGFEKLGRWTSYNRSLWEELFFKATFQNLGMLTNHVFQTEDLSEKAVQPPKLDSNTRLESDSTEIGAMDPAAKSLNFDTSCHPNMVSEAESCPEVVTSGWLPAGLDMVPRAEYCPNALNEYVSMVKEKPTNTLILNVRMHIAHLNWKIEFKKDKSITRFRYTPPNGTPLYSLRLVCMRLLGSGSSDCDNCQIHKLENDSEESQEEKCAELGRDKRKTRNSLRKLKMEEATRSSNELKMEKKKSQSTNALTLRKRVQQTVCPNPSSHNPLTVLCWLIDKNVVLSRAKVYYMSTEDQQVLAIGSASRNGIECDCCKKVYSVNNFEIHAGSNSHKSAANICLEDGRTLLECLRQLIRKERKKNIIAKRTSNLKSNLFSGENDHICSLCQYGGELILCDQCPSSFHKRCLGLKDVPEGNWFCPSCCCKICGQNNLERINGYFVDGAKLSCTQCYRKYHVECVQSRVTDNPDTIPNNHWFCSEKCEQIFECLQDLKGKSFPVDADLIGKSFPLGADNLTWTLLKSRQPNNREIDGSDDDTLIENHIKLNMALDVMHECFEPFEEPITGRDFYNNVIFNTESELDRLNLSGFYTILLEKDEELITVANLRIYGEVAELPLIGTRFQYRRHGMCRILINVLEKILVGLGIQRLVLPAVPSTLNMWISAFGFSKMRKSERLQFVDHTFLGFQDTVMCQKLLMKTPSGTQTAILGTQTATTSNVSSKGDTIVFDGPDVFSSMSQEVLVKESGMVEQEHGKIALGECNSSDNNLQICSEEMVNRQANSEPYDACNKKIKRSFLVEDSNSGKECKSDGNEHTGLMNRSVSSSSGEIRYYKRRKWFSMYNTNTNKSRAAEPYTQRRTERRKQVVRKRI